MAFEHHGFQVHVAASGKQALDLYQSHATQIDMVLLDVCMPDLDGPATLNQLQMINPGLLACFISGNTREHSVDDLLQSGALRLFSKPISMGELTREIKAILSSRLAHSA
jgi:DNA-binding response OmpR family regulator